MLSDTMKKLIEKSRFKMNYEMRALAAYYQSNPKVHPDPNLTEVYYVRRELDDDIVGYRAYVRLSVEDRTLAVFRITNRSELKRLKRWPQSVEDGTAMPRARFEEMLAEMVEFYEKADAERADEVRWMADWLDELFDDREAPTPSNAAAAVSSFTASAA